MANKYANLVGTNKIKDEYTKINTGFDEVEKDIDALNDLVDALDSRVDTIITTPIDGKAAAQEIVDARASAVKSKTFATLDARFEETEQDIATHMADIVTDADGAHGLKIEEGEWTPDMNSNPTITVQQGYYYKIGKKVTVWGKLEYSAKGTDPGELLYIKGLPFATGNPVYGGQIANFRGTSIIIDSASRITGFVNYNVIYLYEVLSTGAASALNFGEINNSGSINFTVTYLTN